MAGSMPGLAHGVAVKTVSAFGQSKKEAVIGAGVVSLLQPVNNKLTTVPTVINRHTVIGLPLLMLPPP